MFDELIPALSSLFDKVANSEEGEKMIDDLGTIVGRLYKNLTEKQGIPEDVAASIIGGFGKQKK